MMPPEAMREERWELRREPTGTVLVRHATRSGIGPPQWGPGLKHPIVGKVRWFCDGKPAGPVFEYLPSTTRRDLPGGLTQWDWSE